MVIMHEPSGEGHMIDNGSCAVVKANGGNAPSTAP